MIIIPNNTKVKVIPFKEAYKITIDRKERYECNWSNNNDMVYGITQNTWREMEIYGIEVFDYDEYTHTYRFRPLWRERSGTYEVPAETILFHSDILLDDEDFEI